MRFGEMKFIDVVAVVDVVVVWDGDGGAGVWGSNVSIGVWWGEGRKLLLLLLLVVLLLLLLLSDVSEGEAEDKELSLSSRSSRKASSRDLLIRSCVFISVCLSPLVKLVKKKKRRKKIYNFLLTVNFDLPISRSPNDEPSFRPNTICQRRKERRGRREEKGKLSCSQLGEF